MCICICPSPGRIGSNKQCFHKQYMHTYLLRATKTSLKRQGPHARTRWKGRRKQPPEAPFSTAFPQIRSTVGSCLLSLPGTSLGFASAVRSDTSAPSNLDTVSGKIYTPDAGIMRLNLISAVHLFWSLETDRFTSERSNCVCRCF